MFTIRLAFVLAFHAILVAAGLVVIAVVYSVLSRNVIQKQVLTVATASIETVRQLALDEVSFIELTVYYMGITLGRLNLNAPLASSSPTIYTYTPTLDVLTAPETYNDGIFIATFTLWRESASDAWSATGCDRSELLCYLYNATTNTSEYTAFATASNVTPLDLTNPSTTSAGVPPRYPRYRSTIDGGNFTVGTLWSPMHLDYATTITTLTCQGVNVFVTFDYFSCTEFGSGTDADGNPICLRLIGATVESKFSAEFVPSSLLLQSVVYVVSVKTQSTVGTTCNPPGGAWELVQKFLDTCPSNELDTCSPIFSGEGSSFYAAVGHSTDNGIKAVLVDIVPRSFFYSAIRNSDTVAIVVSICVIVLVVAVSVAICLVLVIPLSYICTGMRNASTLSYERKVVPLSKYTFIAEVKQLVAAYLELRAALTDLKSFVPQGLLVAADAGVISLSLFDSLDDTGSSSTDGNVESYDDDGDEEEEEGSSCDEPADSGKGGDSGSSGFGGHHQDGDAATARETRERCPFESVAGASGRKEAAARRGGPAARRPRHSPLGVVTVVHFNAAEEGRVASNAHATDVSVSGEGGAGALLGAAGLATAPFARGPPGGTNEASTPPTKGATEGATEMASAAGARSPQRRSRRPRRGLKRMDAFLPPEASPSEYASLNVSPALLARTLNKFRAVTSSVLCVSFSFKYIDSASLETEARVLGGIVVRTALRYGGVMELCRPDLVVMSFGAHVAQTQHTQRAAAAAVSLTRQLSAERRSRTRIVVDSGTLYCGICGGNGRVFPVVFGDRLDAAVDLLRYDLGLGRLVVTDRIAVCLPPEYVVPIDYVVTLRDHAHGTQLFQVLDTRRRGRKREYKSMLANYRLGYTLGLNGQYEQALEVMEGLQAFDQELTAGYAASLHHLINMNPRRPRYCRFQLPGFEPLGVKIKEEQPKFQHASLHLTDLRNNEASDMVSFNFGFGNSPSTSAGHNTPAGGPSRLSRVSGSLEGAPGFQVPLTNSLTHHAHGNNASTGAEHSSTQERFENTAPPKDSADLEAGELPRVFTDRRGEVWHRFPNLLGSGAFAEVYRAISANGTIVALKCIRLSDTKIQLEDVVSEVNTACKLFSDFTVSHTGWVHIGSFLIIIMDYMPGGSLSSVLSAFPSGVTLQVARRYASDALRGLAYLHSKNVVHADLKLQNILLSTDGGCRLSDFGSSVTKANAKMCAGDVFQLRGTPLYMSPEVARGDSPTMMSDVWSFGISLYEILTGHTPWHMKRTTNPAGPTVSVVPPSCYADPRGDLVVEGVRVFSQRTSHASSRKSTFTGAGLHLPALATCTGPTAAPPHPEPATEWVRLQGLSDARVVQGIVKGTVRAEVVPGDLPNTAAYDLVMACLRTKATERPPARELLDHPFFFT